MPFAPFGIATVSRSVQPALDEFLYALSRGQGADPTRDSGHRRPTRPATASPTASSASSRQQDHGLWQDQTGGPTDPQAGNIPGGKRDVLRTRRLQRRHAAAAFAVDSGMLGGQRRCAAGRRPSTSARTRRPSSTSTTTCRSTTRSRRRSRSRKPTGGWKANAYVIFDYFCPTDFKFAGIDVSTNKLVIGHRNASGWIVDAKTPRQVSDTVYDLLVSVNGTTVTVRSTAPAS